MVPFKIRFSPGQSIFDQVCFAAIKSILAGELKAGEAFPSVRTLALDLKIHPNTAHKVVQHLVQERWLVVQPGLAVRGVVLDENEAVGGDNGHRLDATRFQVRLVAARGDAATGSVLPHCPRSRSLRAMTIRTWNQKSWFSPPKTSETESSVKIRRIESVSSSAQLSTRRLSGGPGRSGIVSVTTICSKPDAARFS